MPALNAKIVLLNKSALGRRLTVRDRADRPFVVFAAYAWSMDRQSDWKVSDVYAIVSSASTRAALQSFIEAHGAEIRAERWAEGRFLTALDLDDFASAAACMGRPREVRVVDRASLDGRSRIEVPYVESWDSVLTVEADAREMARRIPWATPQA